MSTSTNGQICYGIVFEEDYTFPWSEFDDDIEEWWLTEVHGFKHSFEIYDSLGGYLNGKKPTADESKRYFDEKRTFKDEHPLPVEVVNYCSGDYPMYILAVPGTMHKAYRGEPTEFNPTQLGVSSAERTALLSFCNTYGLEGTEPAWLLTSYWG